MSKLWTYNFTSLFFFNVGTTPCSKTLHIVDSSASFKGNIGLARRALKTTQRGSDTHHAVYLRLASLGQVYNIDPIVVEILHAAVKVLPQESSRLSGQRDPTETQLLEGRRSRGGREWEAEDKKKKTTTTRNAVFWSCQSDSAARSPAHTVYHQSLSLTLLADPETPHWLWDSPSNLHSATSPLTLDLCLGCVIVQTSKSIWQLAKAKRVSLYNICKTHSWRETLEKFAYYHNRDTIRYIPDHSQCSSLVISDFGFMRTSNCTKNIIQLSRRILLPPLFNHSIKCTCRFYVNTVESS